MKLKQNKSRKQLYLDLIQNKHLSVVNKNSLPQVDIFNPVEVNTSKQMQKPSRFDLPQLKNREQESPCEMMMMPPNLAVSPSGSNNRNSVVIDKSSSLPNFKVINHKKTKVHKGAVSGRSSAAKLDTVGFKDSYLMP